VKKTRKKDVMEPAPWHCLETSPYGPAGVPSPGGKKKIAIRDQVQRIFQAKRRKKRKEIATEFGN